MEAGAAAPFLDFGEIGALVHAGIRVLVPRDGVEARDLSDTAADDGVRHADNGGRVHAAAKLGENGAIGTESALDGSGEDGAEVFFVFGVGPVTDLFGGIKIPILADRFLPWS